MSEQELAAENERLRAQIEAVRALVVNARKHAGGSFTAHVDALSIERALSTTAGCRTIENIVPYAISLDAEPGVFPGAGATS